MKKSAGSVPPGASLVLNPSINYFLTQPADCTVSQTFIETIPPLYSLDHKTAPLEFQINASNTLYTDLRQTSLLLRIKVVKVDGGNLTNEKLTTVNLLSSSLFKECEVFVNGKLLNSETGDHYGLRSYIQTQFSMSSNRKETMLSASGYYKDSGKKISTTTNPGQSKRAALIKDSASVELLGSITCGLFQTSRYLPPLCQVTLRFKRQNPEFVLLAELEEGATAPTSSPYKIEFTHAQLNVVRHQITEPYASQIERQMKSHKPYLSFKRSDLKLIHIPSNLYTSSSSNVLIGTLPEKVLIGLVPSTDLIGSITTNPYYFMDHGLESIVINVDSDSGSFRQEIKIDVEKNQIMEGYQSLQNVISNPETQGMSISEYLDGNLIFAFNTLPESLESTSQLIRKGRIDLSLKFKTVVTRPLSIIVYSQYDSAYTFNSEGEYTLVE